MTPEEELLNTIEEIRKSDYSEISMDLVKEIVQIETNFIENRTEAHRRISSLLDQHLAENNVNINIEKK